MRLSIGALGCPGQERNGGTNMNQCFKIILFTLCLASGAAQAATITLVGVMSGRAMMQVDGTTRTLTAGQTVSGTYKLVEVGVDHVVLESQGRKQTVSIGGRATGAANGEETAFLSATSQGHYIGSGTINDRPVRFLVDTGATNVSMGMSEARRLGLDKLDGRRGASMTANGIVQTVCVRVEKVTLGDIAMTGVDTCYAERDMPVVLLGMSFLSRTDMKVVGSQLQLKKRY